MKEPKTLRTGFREKLAKIKHGFRSTYRDRHKADDSSPKVSNETLQTSQVATNVASHVDGADTERVNIEGPAAACSQLEHNTSEQPPQLAASDEIPHADDAQASTDATAQHALASPVVSLWDEAYKILITEHPKLAMDAFEDDLLRSGSTDSSPDHAVTINRPHAEKEKLIQEMAQEKLERLSQNRLRLSIRNKEYEVRDQLKKTFQFVIYFKDLISFAVSHEPSAALAWSGILVALQLLNTGLKQDEDAASGLEYVTDVMLRCRMFQNELQDIDLLDRENEQHTALMKSLRDSTIKLYTKVLQYHIEIIRHYNGQAVKRSFKDFVGVPQWKEQKQEIVRIDDEITRKQLQLNYHVVQKMEEEFRKFDAENTKQHEKTQQRVDAGIEDAHIRGLDSYFKHDATFVLEGTVKGRKPGCLLGTRTTILKSIRDWILDDQGPTIYWLHAMSGTGKSTVARTVAAALSTDTLARLGVKSDEAAPGRFKQFECSLAASFFFSQGDEGRNTTKYVFLTILRCFTLQPTYGRKIRKFVAEACADMDNIMSKGYTGLWDEFISKQLPKFVNETMETPERWVVIIDALDECQVDKHEIFALLGKLAQCNQLRKDHLQIRFLVTSRRVTHVTEAFRKVEESQYRSECLEMVNVTDPNRKMLPDNDIEIFLRDELGRITEERGLAPQGKEWPGEDAINRLAMKSQGLFIYAATCSRFLDNDLAEEQLDGILNDTTEKGSPQDLLFEMYGKIMEASGGKSGLPKMQALKDILGPLIVLAEPVSINVLALLLPRRDLDYVEARLRGLHSVIDVPKDANAPVTIHHLSFHDFLVDPQTNDTHNWLWIDEIKTHTRMLERCLDILEECLRDQDICGVRLPDFKVDELSQDSIEQYIKPHVRYACRYWVHHLSKSSAASAPEVADKVYDFLKTRFLFWVEAMAWMEEMSATIAMVVQLREIFKPGSRVEVIAKDAWRFLLTNRSGVESAPLQLYCSALLFSPLKSEIRKLYGDEHIPSWITRHPQVAEHWSPQLFVLEGARFSNVKISADSTIISAIQDGSSVFLWNLITGALISILKLKDRIIF
ncbi:hypothetical protein VSDG_03039 [Cytospora chrysosperma]|uniref:Uncharacterized protein n=1 Tax=Cytospora chrysosperma TaxID=252740 RepID=A0A423W8W5_CYTCH|nr:hypothetical protein VSDG_03039 [Valsa sordida]